MDETLLILHLRTARNKAREAAMAEALSLLDDLNPAQQKGGPLSECAGVFWISLPRHQLSTAIRRLPRLGYASSVDTLEPLSASSSENVPRAETVKWRGERYRVIRVYEEDADTLRELAPDRREFLFEGEDGAVRRVRGYRGDGKDGSRRGLPVYDARLLANLAGAREGALFLDPFGGIGGVVLEALSCGSRVFSVDNDPILRHGLADLGAHHAVADARSLPFPSNAFDAIGTEPPYHEAAQELVVKSLAEMHRVCKPGGRIALLCAEGQTEALRREGERLGLVPFLDSPINRKGLGVAVLAWRKTLLI